jgi:hypothetical protein
VLATSSMVNCEAMTLDRNDVPSREQVLAVVWNLMKKAKEAAEPDHTACAKYAELLLKRGGSGSSDGKAKLPADLVADIGLYSPGTK